jgi:hypothetical protein
MPKKNGQFLSMQKKTLSKERAARMLTDLAMGHLSQYSPAEQDARIRAFRLKAATSKKTS